MQSTHEKDWIDYSDEDMEIVDVADLESEFTGVDGTDPVLPIRANLRDDFVDLQVPKKSGGVNLPYTIPTYVGMIQGNGRPTSRALPRANLEGHMGTKTATIFLHRPTATIDVKHLKFPNIKSILDFEKYEPPTEFTEIAVECLRSHRSVSLENVYTSRRKQAANFAANLEACRSKLQKDDLIAYIRTRKRLDLEQAAAVAVSAIHSDGKVREACELVKELAGVLATSSMWLTDHEAAEVERHFERHCCAVKGYATMCTILNRATGTEVLSELPTSTVTYSQLLPILYRVRRMAPQDRCLIIPRWMFATTQSEMPAHYTGYFAEEERIAAEGHTSVVQASDTALDRTYVSYPLAPRSDDTIVLSRKSFRSLQRLIFRQYRFWDPVEVFRHDLKELESDVIFATKWVEDEVLKTNDVRRIAHYFFQFQRRLQLKIVGVQYAYADYEDLTPGFFQKGEGAKYYQNNLSIQSSFEQVLRRIAGLENAPVSYGGGDTIELIDKTCLLMKRYVDIFGNGKTANLVELSTNSWYGSVRGPVDYYNLLCDILRQLKERAKDEWILDVPGSVHKFLAKDIMYYNSSWDDDAFANGKVPGWEPWLEKRGLL